MARLSDVQQQVLGGTWTNIAWAASHGYTATDAVAGFADAYSQLGRPLSFDEAGAIATLYGYARRMENAAAVLQGGELNDPIHAGMIATPPWARDQPIMDTSPIWHATYEITYLDESGQLATALQTSVFEMTLPETVGELAADIQTDAEATAGQSLGATQILDVRPISLLAV